MENGKVEKDIKKEIFKKEGKDRRGKNKRKMSTTGGKGDEQLQGLIQERRMGRTGKRGNRKKRETAETM
jgi:hypothetical protein